MVFALQFEAFSEYLPAFLRTDRIGEHPTGGPRRLWGPLYFREPAGPESVLYSHDSLRRESRFGRIIALP